jgi:hypothetical protein
VNVYLNVKGRKMIERILNWFRTAKPQPSLHDAAVQIGCHYEEVAEMVEAVDEGGIDAEAIADLAEHYKRLHTDIYAQELAELTPRNHEDLLDALCDQVFTAIGVAYMMGYDIAGALEEVCRSNESKFEDGGPVFDADGKIAKGRNYTTPDLKRFTRR